MRQSYRKFSDANDSLVNSTDTNKTKFLIGYESADESSDNTETSHLIYESSLTALDNAVSRLVDRNRPILGVTGDTYFQPSSLLSNDLGMVNIHRPIYSQKKFSTIFEENISQRKRSTVFNDVRKLVTQQRDWCEILFAIFPLINVLRYYNVRKSLPLDFLSGFTTGILRIPQNMAYALLASLPPVFGLYTAFFSAILYPVFGGSNHIVTGVHGIVAIIIGAGVTEYLQEIRQPDNVLVLTNSSTSIPINPFLEHDIDVAITITFMVGVIQCLLGIFRFGFLTNYLSDPLIGGFTTACACIVLLGRLPTLIGISVGRYSGALNNWYLLYDLFSNIGNINPATVLISIFCFGFLSLCKYLSYRFIKQLKVPIPGELIAMVGLTAFAHLMNIESRFNVRLLGDVHQGFPPLRLPNPKYMIKTISVSISSAIVSFAIGFTLSKELASQKEYECYGNREMFAFGFMNCIGSFFNLFAATATLSESVLHVSLGGVSQVANIIASFLILISFLYLGNILEPVPECVLSAVIVINLKSIFTQFGDLKHLWKVSKFDFLLWVACFIAVIVLTVDLGFLVGVVFSLMAVVFRTQWPYSCLLGRIASTDIYKNIALTPDAVEIPGIKIFRFEGSLYFASADHFRQAIKNTTGVNATKIINVQKEREKKLIKVKEQARHFLDHNYHAEKESTNKLLDNSIIDLNIQDTHHIIIDFSTCAFMDSVGVRILMNIINEYQVAQVHVFLANVRAAVRAIIIDCNDLYKCISTTHIFLSVHDAVLGALEDEQIITERNYTIKDTAIKSGTRYVSRRDSNSELTSTLL